MRCLVRVSTPGSETRHRNVVARYINCIADMHTQQAVCHHAGQLPCCNLLNVAITSHQLVAWLQGVAPAVTSLQQEKWHQGN